MVTLAEQRRRGRGAMEERLGRDCRRRPASGADGSAWLGVGGVTEQAGGRRAGGAEWVGGEQDAERRLERARRGKRA
ncbi:unnamed protein product [Arctogadus glacialis]